MYQSYYLGKVQYDTRFYRTYRDIDTEFLFYKNEYLRNIRWS